jgi:hypothetical protein
MVLRTLHLPLVMAIGRHLSNRKTCRLLMLPNTGRRLFTGSRLPLPNTGRHLYPGSRLATGRRLVTGSRLVTGRRLPLVNTGHQPLPNTDYHPALNTGLTGHAPKIVGLHS